MNDEKPEAVYGAKRFDVAAHRMTIYDGVEWQTCPFPLLLPESLTWMPKDRTPKKEGDA